MWIRPSACFRSRAAGSLRHHASHALQARLGTDWEGKRRRTSIVRGDETAIWALLFDLRHEYAPAFTPSSPASASPKKAPLPISMPVQRSMSSPHTATVFLLFCCADAYPSTPSTASHVIRSPASARASPPPYLHLQFSQFDLPQAPTPRANGEAHIASQRLVSPPPAPPPPKQCPPSLWLLLQVALLHITTAVPLRTFIIRRSALAVAAAARSTLALPLTIVFVSYRHSCPADYKSEGLAFLSRLGFHVPVQDPTAPAAMDPYRLRRIPQPLFGLFHTVRPAGTATGSCCWRSRSASSSGR